MKNILIIIALLCGSITTYSQSNNSNGTILPVSNPTLPSNVSNSNNSNSGVNPNGNPGTITNSNANSASKGFQTPTPAFEPGTKLTSAGNNAVAPPIFPIAGSNKLKKDTTHFVDAKPLNNSLPKLTEEQRKAHIDSVIRAIDRRENNNKTTSKKTYRNGPQKKKAEKK
ncbi:MAG: hypothetical protein ABI091_20400 [Ferruginibacter sp.]